MNERTESALLVIFMGTCFFLIGGLLLFDRLMMMAGNILFGSGVIMLIGPQFVLNSQENMKSFMLFLVGMTLVFCNFALFGFIFQVISVLYIIRHKIPSLRSIIIRNVSKIFTMVRFF